MNPPTLTYIACPYTHANPAIMEQRFHAVNAFAVEIMNGDRDRVVFSPISHSHPIATAGDLPPDWDYWARFDRAFLTHSRELLVLMLPGWAESRGVSAEIEIAKELGIPIYYCAPPDAM